MLVAFLPTSVEDLKIIYGYNFVALLSTVLFQQHLKF